MTTPTHQQSPGRRHFLLHTIAAPATFVGLSTAASYGEPLRPAGRRAAKVRGRTTDARVSFFPIPDGNAIDAAVATALIAAVQAPSQTGIGGYGLSAIVSLSGGQQILAVDANSTAPQSMTRDIFCPGPDGAVPDRKNDVGWLAAGVPGVLAGLQLLIDRFGSLKLETLLQPALKITRGGFPWPAGYAAAIASKPIFAADPGSKKLYFRNGAPLAAGETFRNPELAELLQTLASRNSVNDFYRCGIAQQLADAFKANGGLVTAADLAAYQAKTTAPLVLQHGKRSVCTPPLTAGGISVLQMLQTWLALPHDLSSRPDSRPHCIAETMRIAWRDRLMLLGDPTATAVPHARLLSQDYARQSATAVAAAVNNGQILDHQLTGNSHAGTIHISAADDQGNLIALTLTHGNSFGACVTAAGLGLTLGHGMSRFDPRPDHPNSPGPGKKPLHNMVPVIACEDSKPKFAIGGAGGRKIPNSIFSVLRPWLADETSLDDAVAAPRMHTEGTLSLELTANSARSDRAKLQKLGYAVRTASSAVLAAEATF
ncbi:MAG: gamma-glutamyltransferase [Planctomycetaceae bacterium]